jgi:hypothetical protein
MIPVGTGFAESFCGGGRLGTSGTETRLGRPKDFPLCPCARTMYTAKPATPECRLVKVSVVVACCARSSFNVGCKGNSEIVWKASSEFGPERSARCTSILPGLRINSPSLVSVGVVQVSVTVSPLRIALRSPTKRGMSAEGGSGAPGTPQPSRLAARTRTRTDGRVFCKIGNFTAEDAELAEKHFEKQV